MRFNFNLLDFFTALNRRKTPDADRTSQLARCLTLVDLTGLGVGSTLGLGVYVLAGSVAKSVAGPAVCISFLVAAVASAVAALCYAEFAARVPQAGSAYVYSYVSVGEFVAFVIGWNLILEYVIGTASVARGLSNYIDALAGKAIRDAFREWMPMDVSFLSPYPDFLAFGFVLLLTALLTFGVKESSRLNNAFTVLNLATIVTVLVAGTIKADTANWNIPESEVEPKYGKGGFAPFGFSGIMAGAAKCFYGFVGFDAIATTGEEAKNPRKNIPLAIVISLAIIFFAYFSISAVLTLALPYYLQDADAPFPHLFDELGWPAIKWIVTVGAIFALCTSLLGAMFPLPRIIYAMASDGLIFRPMAAVNSYTKTPLIASVFSGLLTAAMATIFDLEQLIDMMSIGTLLAYTLVAVSVLILRYEEQETSQYPGLEIRDNEKPLELTFANNVKDVFNLHNFKTPSKKSSYIVNWSIGLFSIFTALLCAIIVHGHSTMFSDSEPFLILGFAIGIIGVVVLLIVIARQPRRSEELSFKVPLVPLIPCLSVIFNLYLMLELDLHTWIRFLGWLIIGFLIYFAYGMTHSSERFAKRTEVPLSTQKQEVTKF